MADPKVDGRYVCLRLEIPGVSPNSAVVALAIQEELERALARVEAARGGKWRLATYTYGQTMAVFEQVAEENYNELDT